MGKFVSTVPLVEKNLECHEKFQSEAEAPLGNYFRLSCEAQSRYNYPTFPVQQARGWPLQTFIVKIIKLK